MRGIHCEYVHLVIASVFLSDACDPSWSSTRYGLIIAAFVASMVAYNFAAAAIWVHVCYHISKKTQITSSQL